MEILPGYCCTSDAVLLTGFFFCLWGRFRFQFLIVPCGRKTLKQTGDNCYAEDAGHKTKFDPHAYNLPHRLDMV